MRIILATRNPTKLAEIRALLAPLNVRIESLDDAGIEGEAVEDATTLEENALKKARFAHERASDAWCIADDTGMFVHALSGEPGIYTARWGGGNLKWEDRTAYCLARMQGIADRSATFKAVAAVVSPNGTEQTFTGSVDGCLLEAPATRPKPKMPYSCLFMPQGETRTWAQMSDVEENEISHRGKAFRQVLELLLDE